jgi:hypothetical protein
LAQVGLVNGAPNLKRMFLARGWVDGAPNFGVIISGFTFHRLAAYDEEIAKGDR